MPINKEQLNDYKTLAQERSTECHLTYYVVFYRGKLLIVDQLSNILEKPSCKVLAGFGD